jgi:hypothetical protein
MNSIRRDDSGGGSVLTSATARAAVHSRQGIAALIALVCLSLATIIGTLLLQAALAEQRYLNRLELQSQGEWLVEAGFSRARAQLAKSARYSGETWTIPGSSFSSAQNATVRIAVRTDASPVAHVQLRRPSPTRTSRCLKCREISTSARVVGCSSASTRAKSAGARL